VAFRHHSARQECTDGLDDPSDLTCKDSTQQYSVDNPRRSCKHQVSVWLTHCPSMGLLRRPTTGGIAETDDWAGPAGRARFTRI
jgi:hypothetical protein